jgi:hypothetical protein
MKLMQLFTKFLHKEPEAEPEVKFGAQPVNFNEDIPDRNVQRIKRLRAAIESGDTRPELLVELIKREEKL